MAVNCNYAHPCYSLGITTLQADPLALPVNEIYDYELTFPTSAEIDIRLLRAHKPCESHNSSIAYT